MDASGVHRPGLLGSTRPIAVVRDQRDRALRTHQATRDLGTFQYSQGIEETLSWALGELFAGPSGEPGRPDEVRLLVEVQLLKRFATDPDSPAYYFAAGAVAALWWLAGVEDIAPVTWADPPV